MLTTESTNVLPDTVDVEKAADGELRVDSRKLAGPIGVEHRHLFRLLRTHEADFAELGTMRFENASSGARGGGGWKVRYAMLNEDQAYLLLTYAKNTPEARRLKKHLIVTFRRAREALEGRVLVNVASFKAAIQIARDEAAARERGSIGGQLLSKWRREKPVYEGALKQMHIELQLVLPLG